MPREVTRREESIDSLFSSARRDFAWQAALRSAPSNTSSSFLQQPMPSPTRPARWSTRWRALVRRHCTGVGLGAGPQSPLLLPVSVFARQRHCRIHQRAAQCGALRHIQYIGVFGNLMRSRLSLAGGRRVWDSARVAAAMVEGVARRRKRRRKEPSQLCAAVFCAMRGREDEVVMRGHVEDCAQRQRSSRLKAFRSSGLADIRLDHADIEAPGTLHLR
jgi:hypothetical protein